jgi:aspartyl protease family protein
MMLRPVILFLSIAGGTAALASQALQFVAKPGSPSAMIATAPKATTAPTQTTSGYRTVTLRDDGRGHFQVQANVDGRWVDFLIDTGASVVALREGSAARLGIFPKASDYTARIQTANGTGKAARVTLNRIDINGVSARNVQAIVVPDDQLSVNLLGMSFLSNVKWSHDRGKLVLEQ